MRFLLCLTTIRLLVFCSSLFYFRRPTAGCDHGAPPLPPTPLLTTLHLFCLFAERRISVPPYHRQPRGLFSLFFGFFHTRTLDSFFFSLLLGGIRLAIPSFSSFRLPLFFCFVGIAVDDTFQPEFASCVLCFFGGGRACVRRCVKYVSLCVGARACFRLGLLDTLFALTISLFVFLWGLSVVALSEFRDRLTPRRTEGAVVCCVSFFLLYNEFRFFFSFRSF